MQYLIQIRFYINVSLNLIIVNLSLWSTNIMPCEGNSKGSKNTADGIIFRTSRTNHVFLLLQSHWLYLKQDIFSLLYYNLWFQFQVSDWFHTSTLLLEACQHSESKICHSVNTHLLIMVWLNRVDCLSSYQETMIISAGSKDIFLPKQGWHNVSVPCLFKPYS